MMESKTEMDSSPDIIFANIGSMNPVKYQAVVALDIGTTYSGYAFATTDKPKDIFLNRHWGHIIGITNNKTPTAVLTDIKGKFVAFGYEAKKLYAENTNDYHLFESDFKMELYNNKGPLDIVKVKSQNGKLEIPLLELTTMTIGYLYREALKELARSKPGYDESMQSYIRVVLTIPTIWGDRAKTFMKEAACNVRIDPNRVLLALEPDAASLYCRSINIREFNTREAVHLNLSTGSCYCVIDCGGGTVDITAHEVSPNDCVKEIYCANGGPFGGGETLIKFIKLLEDVLGSHFVNSYKQRKADGWYEIDKKFELMKRTYHQHAKIAIDLPVSLIREYNRPLLKNIFKDVNKRKKKDGISLSNEYRLTLSFERASALFEPTIERIVNFAKQLLSKSELANIKYVFMVGGFSNCDSLYAKMQRTIEELKPHTKVLRLAEADIAVVKGGVLFGLKPDLIASRIARITHGIGVMVPFDPSIHDSRKRKIIDGQVKCVDVFMPLIKRGQCISVGTVKTITLHPDQKLAQMFELSIYTSNRENSEYVTDDGVKHVKTMTIPIPNNELPLNDRSIKLNVFFDGVVLSFRIQDTTGSGGATTDEIITYL